MPAHGELLYTVHELSRLISIRFDQAMTAHGLTRAQWWGLMHISEHEGSTQTELADIMEMGRASAGKLLERLEKKGWIERRADPGDSRVRRVFLTQADVSGVMAIEGVKLFSDLLGNISRDEEEALLAGLRKIRQNAERSLGKATS